MPDPISHSRNSRVGHSDTSLPVAGAVPLDLLRSYAEAVLAGLAENRDLRSEGGRPCYRVQTLGENSEATWLWVAADFSAIGMAIDMPLIVTAFTDADTLEWKFGPALIARTPRAATAKAAADSLDMDVLLVAFCRFAASELGTLPKLQR